MKRSGGNIARVLAIKLSREKGSMKLSEIVKLFGLGGGNGVAKTIGRLDWRLRMTREYWEFIMYFDGP